MNEWNDVEMKWNEINWSAAVATTATATIVSNDI